DARVPFISGRGTGGRDATTSVPPSGASWTGLRAYCANSLGGTSFCCERLSPPPHSRQKLAPEGLSMPQSTQITLSCAIEPPPPAMFSGAGAASRNTEPQSRQYLTWPGLLRPHRPHSTLRGDRARSEERRV